MKAQRVSYLTEILYDSVFDKLLQIPLLFIVYSLHTDQATSAFTRNYAKIDWFCISDSNEEVTESHFISGILKTIFCQTGQKKPKTTKNKTYNSTAKY